MASFDADSQHSNETHRRTASAASGGSAIAGDSGSSGGSGSSAGLFVRGDVQGGSQANASTASSASASSRVTPFGPPAAAAATTAQLLTASSKPRRRNHSARRAHNSNALAQAFGNATAPAGILPVPTAHARAPGFLPPPMHTGATTSASSGTVSASPSSPPPGRMQRRAGSKRPRALEELRAEFEQYVVRYEQSLTSTSVFLTIVVL